MKILTVLLFAVVVWRMIWPLKYKWYVKTALACFAALGAFKFQIFRIIGGHYFSPDLPEWVIIAGAWLYGAFYFVPPMLICSEVVRLFKWKNSTHLWNKVNLGIAVAALAASGVGLWCGSLDPVISEHSVEITQLPAAADGLKIAFLTDLHIDHTVKKEKVAGLVKRVNSINADLIALGGDLMDGPVSKCGSSMKELENLKAPLGVFGVLGNHEFYSDAAGWLEFFRNSGIKMLINEKVELPGGVMLAGVGDPMAERFFRNSPLAQRCGCDINGTLKDVPEEKIVILLAHRPKIAGKSAAAGVDLQLSGHTHGGMITGLDKIVALYNGGWVSGRYKVGNMTLLVSNGTWLWRGFPLRLGRPGEILLITLKQGSRK